MKSIFSLTLISSALCSLAQADFYVASSGSDSNAGTFAEPFASIQHAVDQSAANDTIFIRGGTYREEVNLRNHSDLLLTAYNEETVIISGCDLVSSEWTPAAHDANIQQTPFVSDDVMQLFIAGERMNLARYPDEDAEQNMFSFSEWTDTLTERQVAGVGQNRVLFRDWEDGQFPDDHWAGGFYSGRNGENPFSAASGKIGSSSGRYLHVFEKNFFWEREAGTGNSCIGDGVGYIINHLNALSISTEWYWDADSDTLYCYPPTGTSLAESSVEARVRLWGADLSGAENVRVEGIDFFASSIKMEESQSCTISNCRVKYPAPWTDEFYGTTNHDYGDVIDGSTGIFVSKISTGSFAACSPSKSSAIIIRRLETPCKTQPNQASIAGIAALFSKPGPMPPSPIISSVTRLASQWIAEPYTSISKEQASLPIWNSPTTSSIMSSALHTAFTSIMEPATSSSLLYQRRKPSGHRLQKQPL